MRYHYSFSHNLREELLYGLGSLTVSMSFMRTFKAVDANSKGEPQAFQTHKCAVWEAKDTSLLQPREYSIQRKQHQDQPIINGILQDKLHSPSGIKHTYSVVKRIRDVAGRCALPISQGKLVTYGLLGNV